MVFTKPSHKVYYRKLYAFKCGLYVVNNILMVWFLQRSPHLTFAVLCGVSIRLTNCVRSSGVTQTEITWSRPIWQNRHGRGESVRRARRDAIASECVRASVRPADLINYHQMYPHFGTAAATSLLPVIGQSSLVGGTTTTLPSTAALFPAGCNGLDLYTTRRHHLRQSRTAASLLHLQPVYWR